MNGINSNYNSISTLFGSLGTNNMMGSFNFSDYASIKNGSYSKIVKAYYAGPVEKAPTSNKTETDKTSTNSKIKEISADTSDLTQMKKKADRLSVAADDLNKSGLYNTGSEKYARNAITDAVKKFADEYNSVVKQSSKVASKEITGAVNSMKSMTTTMNKALEKIGLVELCEAGFVNKTALVKILGNGELKAKLTVEAHAFSKSAEAAIQAAGGEAVKL